MDGRTGWEDPDDPVARPPGAFVDRVPEAQALAAALVQYRARMDADTISTRELRNVLVFFGDGGVGKSELSARLARRYDVTPSC
jgi:putative ribosome biogenesis GTPase RsgA